MNTPPTARALEAAIRGRPFTAAPGLAGAGGGPDATAYRVGACRALEAALGATADERTRVARRLLCCAAWIEVHAAHIHLVQAAEYLGHPDRPGLVRAEPDAVGRGLQLHRLGAAVADAVVQGEVAFLRPRLQDAVEAASHTVHWVAGFNIPDSSLDVPLLALDDPLDRGAGMRYPLDGGIGVLTTSGLGFPLADFESYVSRPRTTAAHPTRARLRGVKAVLTGPLARYALCGKALRPTARAAAIDAGLDPRDRNPHHSVLIRAVELVHALEEAINLVDRFEPPPPTLPRRPHAGRGFSAVEGPSGLLYQRYDLAADGTVTAARLIGPQELNRTAIDLDKRRTAREALRVEPLIDSSPLAVAHLALEHVYLPRAGTDTNGRWPP